MKRCDLCRSRATSYCEADGAYLCWACDAKVHGANFLVARHERGLLCRACQSLTPWRASGSARLCYASSFCAACAPSGKNPRLPEEDGGASTEEVHQGPPPSSRSDGTSSSSSSSTSSFSRGDRTKRSSSSSPNRTCSPLGEGNNGSSTDQGPKPSTRECARLTLTPR